MKHQSTAPVLKVPLLIFFVGFDCITVESLFSFRETGNDKTSHCSEQTPPADKDVI